MTGTLTSLNIVPILFVLFVLGIPNAFGTCESGTFRKIEGKFKIVKVEKARLKCEWDSLGHKVNPTAYFDAKGCYVDLKVIRLKSLKDESKYKSSIVSIYANGLFCDRKVDEEINLTITGSCCDGKGLITCEKKDEKMKLLAEGDPESPQDMICLSGRYSIENGDYPWIPGH